MRRLIDALTVVLVTSAAPSAPSTLCVDAVISSLERIDGLSACRLIIMCDEPRIVAYDEHKRRMRWKTGEIPSLDHARRYDEYCRALRTKYEDRGRVVRNENHRGFALSVKDAMALVETEFVLTLQHDRPFVCGFDALLQTMAKMRVDDRIKYVLFPTVPSKKTVDLAQGRYNVDLLRGRVSVNDEVSLLPILFWYDSTHLTTKDYYLNFIFRPIDITYDSIKSNFQRKRLPKGRTEVTTTVVLKRGDFIEDVVGQAQLSEIQSFGMKKHARFGTYAIDSEVPLVAHVDGRSSLWETTAEKNEDSRRLAAKRLELLNNLSSS